MKNTAKEIVRLLLVNGELSKTDIEKILSDIDNEISSQVYWDEIGKEIVDPSEEDESLDIARVRLGEVKTNSFMSNKCCNESGVLWESIWKYEDGVFMSKVCASGLFVDWFVYIDEAMALNAMVKEITTINKVAGSRYKHS